VLIEELIELEKKCRALLDENRFFKVVDLVEKIDIQPTSQTFRLIEVNNCNILADFILKKIQIISLNQLPMDVFEVLHKIVDDCYLYVKRVTRKYQFSDEEKKRLRAKTLAIKLGGKIPVSFLLDSENEKFIKFIQSNYLQHTLFALRLSLLFDREDGPSIPVQIVSERTQWITWKEIEQKRSATTKKIEFFFGNTHLFTTNFSYVLDKAFSCLYNGITPYNIYVEPKLLPYDRQDPKQWNHKHILEVWIVCRNKYTDKPSMFLDTHAYIILKDEQGFLRSVGQDFIFQDRDNIRKREVLSSQLGYGKLASPDLYVVYPKNARKFWCTSFEITKEQMDQIIEMVVNDKKNANRLISLSKKNCVSYVRKILKEILDIEIDSSMYCLHILCKSFLPEKWYRTFYKLLSPKYQKLSPKLQKALYFFPPFYLLHFFLTIGTSILSQNNQGDHKDFYFLETLLKPWTLSADHPLQLHRQLEKYGQ